MRLLTTVGSPYNQVLFLESGKLSIVAEECNDARVFDVLPGEYIGETDLMLNNSIRKYKVVSVRKSTVYVMKRNDFKMMLTLFMNELEEFKEDAKRRSENL